MNLREIKKRAAKTTVVVKKMTAQWKSQSLAKLDDFRKSSVTHEEQTAGSWMTEYKQLTSLAVAGVMVFTSGLFAYQNVSLGNMEMAENEPVVIKEKTVASVIPTELVKDPKKAVIEAPKKVNTIIADRRIIKGKQPMILPTLLAEVGKYATVGMDGYTLSVDGREVGFFNSEAEAKNTIASYEKKFTVSANVIEAYFKETISTIPVRREAAFFTGYQTKDQALSLIAKGTDVEKSHLVADGESFWSISSKYNISVDDLIKANPGVTPERIQAGDKLSLVVAKPLLTFCTVENNTYAEAIPFTTRFKDDSGLYKGTSKVTAKGINGEKEITAKLVRENGVPVKRLVLNEKIVSNPRDQLVAKGTKKAPTTAATGRFGKPYSRGSYSSGFGRRWGRMHEGVDWSMPVGSPIYAADGGVVEKAGRDGAYGNVVVINHGNGLKTLYAHNSKLLVKPGERVFKGQKIAQSGNTGRTTGPHLHFEVRKNGVPVNPLKYL